MAYQNEKDGDNMFRIIIAPPPPLSIRADHRIFYFKN